MRYAPYQTTRVEVFRVVLLRDAQQQLLQYTRNLLPHPSVCSKLVRFQVHHPYSAKGVVAVAGNIGYIYRQYRPKHIEAIQDISPHHTNLINWRRCLRCGAEGRRADETP